MIKYPLFVDNTAKDKLLTWLHVDICICMYPWGVAALELDSHSDHNKGSDHAPCACPKTHPIDHRS